MRKFLLSTLLLSIVGFSAAQVSFGLRVAPQFTLNRLDDGIDDITIDKSGAGFNFCVGPMLEFELVEKVGFYTGVWFSTKRTAIKVEDTKVVYSLAYLQIPVGFKFYTGDLINDKFRLYFDIAGSFDIKTGESFKEEKSDIEDEPDQTFTKAVDAMVGIGAGTEFDLGLHNKLFFGIRYNRGLFNVLSKDFKNEISQDGELKISNDNIAIEVGIKF